jgi:hypothetical protein
MKNNMIKIPQPKEIIDWSSLISICVDYSEDTEIKDGEYYIFETAMECIFGKEIWKQLEK